MKNVLENRIEPPLDRKIANRNMDNRVQDIPGWGMDADPDNDPTYPMKHSNGADHERLNYVKAPQQRQDIEIFRSIERPNITRVFGTSTPPAGLSGAIRRYAYKFSEATATHWMTLILADRVDVIQGKLNDLKNGVLPNPWIERGWKDGNITGLHFSGEWPLRLLLSQRGSYWSRVRISKGWCIASRGGINPKAREVALG